MSADLPDWVYQLVHEIQRSESGHPRYYRYVGVASPLTQYEEVDCPERKFLALIPDDVQNGVEFATRWQPMPRCHEHGEIAASCAQCTTTDPGADA